MSAGKKSRNRRRREARDRAAATQQPLPLVAPNHAVRCMNCGATPTVGILELCGPCVFGEADTAGGNW